MTVPADSEVLELRRRLAEAEGTLEAIRQGAVDALVVAGPKGSQVFTLHGAQEPYRMLVERMNEGALTVADDGTILYSNRRFAEMTETALEQVVGRSALSYVPLGRRDELKEILQLAASHPVQREMSFVRHSGMMPAMLWAGPLEGDDDHPNILVTVTDLTARLHAEALVSSERFARSLLEQATEAVVVCDITGRITHASRAAEQLFDLEPVGRAFHDVFPLHLSDPDAEALIGIVTGQGRGGKRPAPLLGVEVMIRRPQLQDRHFLLSAGPLSDSSGSPIGCTITLTDITERKRAERHQNMLVAELNHRVKNILAIVRSVASQTIANSASLPVFKGAFDGRLRALALAHDVLTKQQWTNTRLGHLLAESLAPYKGLGSHRVMFTGPEVVLPTQIVVPLAMAIHELSTNAVKYGALSTSAGRLQVSWSVSDDAGDQCVTVVWEELGGPAVPRAPVSGFGTRLISRIAAYDLDGNAQIEFRTEGLRCSLRFPLSAERNQLVSAEATA